MRIWSVPRFVLGCLAACLLTSVCWGGQRETVLNGVRWLYHWVAFSPKGAGEIVCSGLQFGEKGVVVCDPGLAEVWLERRAPVGEWEINSVGNPGPSRSEALRNYRVVNQLAQRPGSPFGTMIFAIAEVMSYTASVEASGAFMAKAKPRIDHYVRYMSKYSSRRISEVLYPLVSTSDPLYHVYVVSGSEIESVWEFRVKAGSLLDTVQFVYDRRHKSIPRRAVHNLQDQTKWYRRLAIANDGHRE